MKTAKILFGFVLMAASSSFATGPGQIGSANGNCLNSLRAPLQAEALAEAERQDYKDIESTKMLKIGLLTSAQALDIFTTREGDLGYYQAKRTMGWTDEEANRNLQNIISLTNDESVLFYSQFYQQQERGFLGLSWVYMKIVAVDRTTCEPIAKILYVRDDE